MGRMHSKGKGISKSALPYKRTPPSWLKVTSNEVRASLLWQRFHTTQQVHGAALTKLANSLVCFVWYCACDMVCLYLINAVANFHQFRDMDKPM